MGHTIDVIVDKNGPFLHSSRRNGRYCGTVLGMEKDFSQLKTFPISFPIFVLKSNWPGYKHTYRVLKCLKLISFHPLPMPLKSKLTITIWTTWAALLTLANYNYFQSHIIQLPFVATLDSADLLANYTSRTMGFSGTRRLILEPVNWQHENTSLPQSYSQAQTLLLGAIKAQIWFIPAQAKHALMRFLSLDNMAL